MMRTRILSLTAGAFLCLASFGRGNEIRLERGRIVRQSANGTTYSVEVPAVAHVQGRNAFFRTSVDINNNTTKSGVTVTYQFSYNCLGARCAPGDNFYRTALQTITLNAIDNFHQDDFIAYLDSLGLLVPGAGASPGDGSIGTLLITFANLPSSQGWEGSAVARVYNRLNEADPLSGTVGFAYNASLFFESADTTLVGYARDTTTAPTIAGTLRSNVGVRNTDINATGQSVTLVLTAYDTVSGAKVGNPVILNGSFGTGLRPGELQQVVDLWATAAISSTVNSVIVFVDNPSPTTSSPTFEGFVNISDIQTTNDASNFEMKCADTNGCGN